MRSAAASMSRVSGVFFVRWGLDSGCLGGIWEVEGLRELLGSSGGISVRHGCFGGYPDPGARVARVVHGGLAEIQGGIAYMSQAAPISLPRTAWGQVRLRTGHQEQRAGCPSRVWLHAAHGACVRARHQSRV